MSLNKGRKAPKTLRQWRLEKKLSQREAAKQFGISGSYLGLIESGFQYPRMPVAKRISEVTGVAIETLIGLVS